MADNRIAVNIQGVDGPVYFPADYTPERIKFAIEKDILPRLNQVEKPDPLVRLGRGVADVTEGVTQAGLRVKDWFTGKGEADAYTKEKDADIATYERGRGKDAGIDWMRLGGNVAMTLPTMAIPGGAAPSLMTRVLAGAGQGAASSAAMYTSEGDSKLAQILTGGLVGGAVPAAIQGVKKAGGAVVDKLRPNVSVTMNPHQAQGLAGEISFKLEQKGIDWSKLTKDVQQSLLADAENALRVGGSMDEAMVANKALIESVGAKPTRASVTRAPRDWQAEKNLRGIVGVGDEIVQREGVNATALSDFLGRQRAATGGKTSTAYETGESAIGAVRAMDATKKKAVTELYDAYAAAGMKDAEVPAARLADSLGRVTDEIGIENIPPAVMSRLKEFGLIDGKQTKLLTVNEADKLNRLINNNNPGRGTPGARALQPIKEALDEALLDVAPTASQGVDALKSARAAHAQRMTEQKAGKGIAAAIDDVAPDRFVKRFVLDADVRDVRALKAELMKGAEGQQALADIKGNILGDLLMKATRSSNIDDVAGKPFSGANFSKALDAIAPEKLHTLFTPDEIGALRQLQKASKLLTEEVPFSDVNHSKTAAAMANLLQKIGNTPLLGGLVSPLIGAGKIGLDWVKNANDRKAVAEVLIGSAVQGGGKPAALSAPGVAARVLPSGAAALSADPGKRLND